MSGSEWVDSVLRLRSQRLAEAAKHKQAAVRRGLYSAAGEYWRWEDLTKQVDPTMH